MGRRWYGSLQNRLLERASGQPEPQVGMGVTECLYTDREPYEIIEVKDERHIVVRGLDCRRVDSNGLSECQEYEYTSNPDRATYTLYKRKDGTWVRRVGTHGVDSHSGWVIGFAEKYYDPSF